MIRVRVIIAVPIALLGLVFSMIGHGIASFAGWIGEG